MQGLLLIICASFIWSLDGIIRYPLLKNGLDALSLVFYEHIILSIIFIKVIFSNLKRVWSSPVSHLVYFVLIGILGSALATYCFSQAFLMINPSLVILIQKLQPLVAVILARIILGEKIRRVFLFWALIALSGVLLITWSDTAEGLRNFSWDKIFEEDFFQGYLYTFVAVIGWGGSTVFGKKLTNFGYKESEIMAGRYIFALLGIIPLVISQRPELSIIPIQGIKIAGLVVLSGLVAMYLYYRGLKGVSARLCTIGELFFPLGAVLLNWIILDLEVTLMQISGGILLILSASMIQFKRY